MDKSKQEVFDSIVPYIKEVERQFKVFPHSYEYFTLPVFEDMTAEQKYLYESFMKDKVIRRCKDCGKVITMNKAYDRIMYAGKCKTCRVQKFSLVNTISGPAYYSLVRDARRGKIFWKGGVVYIDSQTSVFAKQYLDEDGGDRLYDPKGWLKELFRKDKIKPCKVYGDTIIQTKNFCRLVEKLNNEGRKEFGKIYFEY